MKLSEKQALVLLDLAKASLSLVGGWGGYTQDTIRQTVQAIINQQSDELIELEDK